MPQVYSSRNDAANRMSSRGTDGFFAVRRSTIRAGMAIKPGVTDLASQKPMVAMGGSQK